MQATLVLEDNQNEKRRQNHRDIIMDMCNCNSELLLMDQLRSNTWGKPVAKWIRKGQQSGNL